MSPHLIFVLVPDLRWGARKASPPRQWGNEAMRMNSALCRVRHASPLRLPRQVELGESQENRAAFTRSPPMAVAYPTGHVRG